MTTTNGGAVDGGPAFPCDQIIARNEHGNLFGPEISSPGMSLHQWYAGLAMQGLVASGEYRNGTADWIAQEAGAIANAMLAARNPSHG